MEPSLSGTLLDKLNEWVAGAGGTQYLNWSGTPFPRFLSYGAVTVWDGSVATGFAGGTGTESDPYLISNGSQLAHLAQLVNAAGGNAAYNASTVYYQLTNDIYLNDTAGWQTWSTTVAPANTWIPIGNGTAANDFVKSDLLLH